MNNLLITGAHVIDPSQSLDGPADILIINGKIEFVGSAEEAKSKAPDNLKEIDAKGLIATPGLIDIHVHFREPGMSEEETVASGSAAAVAGGFTSVACMPNTDPALDSEADMNFITREAKKANLAWVFPVGAITNRREGKELAEMGNMSRGGAVGFSDDGSAVPTAGLLRRAMTYAKMLDKPILEHCEDHTLAGDGAMNEGFVSTILGLPGIPAEAEEVIVARDLALARLTGCRLHLQHLSTIGSVEMVRRAKSEGIAVTAEVCPHHLVLSEEDVRGYDPNYKVNPPLRTASDIEACLQGLKDGTLDVIASDHAPHLDDEKELEFGNAPCGMIGLETTLGVLLTHLVHTGKITLKELIAPMTCNPSDVLRLNRGRLEKGLQGDVTLINPELEWTVDPAKFRSKSRNCPFNGKTLKGRAVATIVGGKVVYRAE